jgi:hypothetical protein
MRAFGWLGGISERGVKGGNVPIDPSSGGIDTVLLFSSNALSPHRPVVLLCVDLWLVVTNV